MIQNYSVNYGLWRIHYSSNLKSLSLIKLHIKILISQGYKYKWEFVERGLQIVQGR